MGTFQLCPWCDLLLCPLLREQNLYDVTSSQLADLLLPGVGPYGEHAMSPVLVPGCHLHLPTDLSRISWSYHLTESRVKISLIMVGLRVFLLVLLFLLFIS